MNGPYALLMLGLAGMFAFGAVMHAVSMRRPGYRDSHALLAAICLASVGFLLAEARLVSSFDIATHLHVRHVQTLCSGSGLALYALFLARETRATSRWMPALLCLGGALVIWVGSSSPGGRPWLASLDRLDVTRFPWGELVASERGTTNSWFPLIGLLWISLPCYGLLRAVRRARSGERIGLDSLLVSNGFILMAVVHDFANGRGIIHSLPLGAFVPPAMTAGSWWHLSALERRRGESFRGLFVKAGDAMLVHDAGTGVIVEANESACDLLRSPRAALIGSTLETILSPDFPIAQADLRRRLRALQETGGGVREQMFRRADGSEFPAEVSLKPATLEGLPRIIASVRDLTDRRRVEQALIENELRLRTVISRCPIAVIECSLDGRVTAANPRFSTQFAWPVTDDLRLDAIVMPESPGDAALLPLLHHRPTDAIERSGVVPSFRAMVIARDGRVHRADICGVVTDGQAVLFITDVTDILSARDDIARQEAFYRALVGAAADGLGVLTIGGDGDPSVALWNERMSEITGVTAADAAAPGWIARITADEGSAKRLRELLSRGSASGISDEEWLLPRRDGQVRDCSISAKTVPHSSGGRLILTVRDVTAAKRADESRRRIAAQVQHAQKLESLAILAGGIAHDFNNILMSILGRASLLSARFGDAHPSRDHLRSLEQAARRAADLCRQLLAYAGKGRVQIGPVQLHVLVEEIAAALSESLGVSRRIRFVRSYGEGATLIADANQVRQVVMNLVTNAADAIGDREGSVEIALSGQRIDSALPMDMGEDLAPGDYAVLRVTDTGSGMDDETKRRMFEPFFTTKPTGRGLGMAAVLGIIHGHRGGVRIETRVGHGTSVTVFFPQYSGPIVDHTPFAPLPSLSRGGIVLVVDDEEGVRRTTREMLTHLGCEVIEAASGVEAIGVLSSTNLQLRAIVLDLTMPDIDGEETCRRLRAIDDRVPVIMASGYSREEVVRSIGGAGAIAYLQKPYDLDALARALQVAQERSGLAPLGPPRA